MSKNRERPDDQAHAKNTPIKLKSIVTFFTAVFGTDTGIYINRHPRPTRIGVVLPENVAALSLSDLSGSESGRRAPLTV